MAIGGRKLLLLVGLLWTASLTVCFNLEPRAGVIYRYPYASTEGRESYFGFSVALQHNNASNKNWLVVGAPRANSSIYNDKLIPEPGALFKCDLSGAVDAACEELLVDQSGKNALPQSSYQDQKNYGWLGGSLDSQPYLRDDRQVTGVCAPRWRSQHQQFPQQKMDGACYWVDDSDPSATLHPHKEVPLEVSEQPSKTYWGQPYYYNAFGQAGMSIHFPEGETNFIVGAPGLLNWFGTVILYKDHDYNKLGDIGRRRHWIQQRNQMFTELLVPDPAYFTRVKDFDLFGYTVTSGRFLSQHETLYVGGAPRGAEMLGKVIVFDFPSHGSSDLLIKQEFIGNQLGEYFGAALTAADINGDGLSDLVVGSPMYSLPNLADVGRIQTFLSSKGRQLFPHPEPHYGKVVNLARFGTSLASPGDLNLDGYEDIVVGAPWEDSGAVYIFMGSASGLKQQYSQRLSPEDFPVGLIGFGMSMSRGIDVDKNGYPDLAIGSFQSGHAAVIKTRPVAKLSGYVTANPPNVAWENSTNISLTTCLQYTGYKIPRRSSIQVTLTLDHSSPAAPRAIFSDISAAQRKFIQTLTANSAQPECRDDQVTVKSDKIDPDRPIDMKVEYDFVSNFQSDIIKQPMTIPGEIHSSITRVGILKGCEKMICRVDMMCDANLELGQGNKLVVGQRTKPVLRVEVSNSMEPVYLPIMIVKVDPPLTLLLPLSHECKFLDADLRTSLRCSLSNPIKNGSSDIVEMSVDASQLSDGFSTARIQVDVTGEGEEFNPKDNHFPIDLPLEAHANLKLIGHSKEEQLFYKRVGEDRIDATINPRFTHTYIVIKKGPTPLGQVDLTVDIPVSITDGQRLIKIYSPKTEFLQQPFHCTLNNGSFDIDASHSVNPDNSISRDGSDDIEPHIKPITMSAGKQEGEETQYFNCSSNLTNCARLSCSVYNWPPSAELAKLTLDMEVDLHVMAKYIGIKGGAVFMSKATANIQSINPQLLFIGEKTARGKIVTYIQPGTLQAKGIPWWIILLAVLGGLLLLGLLAFGLYKAGFFRRDKMEELKAQQANLLSADSSGIDN